MNEQTLIKHCTQKNPVAQRDLFENYYGQMFNLGMRLLANYHDTEDILILAFMKVFDKIGGFEYRGEGSLRKWVKTIVINEAIRFLNKKKDLRLVESYLNIDFASLQDVDHLPLDAEEAYQIIENMPAGYRTVFNLYAIEGYSHLEISGMLKITQSTSKSQLCKARNYIITKLKNITHYGTPKLG